MISSTTWLHAPTLRFGISTPTSPSPATKPSNRPSNMAAPSAVRIAVVGDVHDDWSLEEDTKALQLLKPDLVLFTGDFGNENVDLVRSIADVDIAKAVILGNHDAWGTQKFSARSLFDVVIHGRTCQSIQTTISLMFPVNFKHDRDLHFNSNTDVVVEKDPVQLQLECLGDEHVGYRRIDFPSVKVSIVGGRPFSCGGSSLFRKKLLVARYGVHDMDESAKRIYQSALGTPEDHSVVLLAHNGPTGLGSNMNDICGRDWFFRGGDHGDPDLAEAIAQLKVTNKLPIPLVVFGHMHKQLAYGTDLRKMFVVGEDDTVYLNGAIVPRVKRLGNEQEMCNRSSIFNETPFTASESGGTVRAFTIAEILDGRVEKVAETWVSVMGEKITLEEEHIMFSRVTRGSGQTL